jgi:predicted RNase H-like HicB family nuclease
VLPDMLVKIAQGTSIEEAAKAADSAIESTLNS